MKKAFTLSEVLITLSIVGIVAALTIPSLMKNYHNRLYVAQLQRAISQIESAIASIKNDEHVDNFYETNAFVDSIGTGEYDKNGKEITMTGSEYFLTKYFKTSKTDCGPKHVEGSDAHNEENYVTVSNNCFATGSKGHMQDNDAYHSVGGAAMPGITDADYCIQTTNGAAICMSIDSRNNIATIHIDVNGPAGPNITGRDAFLVSIRQDEGGTIRDWEWCTCNKQCNSGYRHFGRYAAGCYQAVVDAGWKIEY